MINILIEIRSAVLYRCYTLNTPVITNLIN